MGMGSARDRREAEQRIRWCDHLSWAVGRWIRLEGDGQAHLRDRPDLEGRPLGHITRVGPSDVPPEARTELEVLRSAWARADSIEDLHAEWHATYRRGLRDAIR